jgi:hypothetical protein
VTAGKGDTPGFPLTDTPAVVHSHQRCQQLRMPRNHCRINQTSTSLLQGWRGNCDIQILIYESDPDDVDLREISKVTDYVVAYSCKAGTTYREEMDLNTKIVLGMQETTGDISELTTLCRHITNKASSSRLISKPEASVLLGGLDLVVCSDFIESVSISNNLRLTVSDDKKTQNSLLLTYQKRPAELEQYSLHAFYSIYRENILGKKPSIPHYVGVKGYPTYPVTEGYARHVLIVYKPWRHYPNMLSWLEDFEHFINSEECPKSAKLTYNRVVRRFYDGTQFVEPTASKAQCDANMSQEDAELLLLAGLGKVDGESECILDLQGVPRGIDFTWGKQPAVSDTRVYFGRKTSKISTNNSGCPTHCSFFNLIGDQPKLLLSVMGNANTSNSSGNPTHRVSHVIYLVTLQLTLSDGW